MAANIKWYLCGLPGAWAYCGMSSWWYPTTSGPNYYVEKDNNYQEVLSTPPKLNSSALKNDGLVGRWSFPFESKPIFRGYVKFPGCMFTSWWVCFVKHPWMKNRFFVGCFLHQQSWQSSKNHHLVYTVGPAQKHSSFTSRFIEVNDSKLGWLFFRLLQGLSSPQFINVTKGVFWHIYV